MLGTKLYKNNFNETTYAAMADWCNNNNCTIEDKGDFYEVVEIDTSGLEREFKKRNIESEIKSINMKLSELRGISEYAVIINNNKQYDVIVDGELIIMNDDQFQNYCNELTNKRSELLQQFKELE